MLQFLRKFSRSWVAYALFGLLILSFGLFWGISDIMTDRGEKSKLAIVGKIKIDHGSFQRHFRNVLENQAQAMSQKLGKPVDMAAFQKHALKVGLHQHVLHEMIQRALVLQEAERLGLTVSDDQVRNTIKRTEYFLDDEGNFDRQRFENVLHANMMTEEVFVNKLRDDLTISNFVSTLMGGVRSPKTINEAFFAYDQETRKVQWTLLTEDLISLSSVPAATEEELKKFYDENKALFTLPEFRKLSALRLPLAKFKSKHNASDDEIKAEFHRRERELATPEERFVHQILTLDRETAEKAEKLLAEHTSLEQIKKHFAEGTLITQEIGWVARKNLPQNVANAIFDTAPHGHSEIVRTSNGFHIFLVSKIKESVKPHLETVRDKLQDMIVTQKAKDELYEVIKKVEDDLASGSTFAEVAKARELELHTFDPINGQGRDASGKLLPIDFLPALVKLGFETGEGMESNVQELPAGDALIVRVEAIDPAHPLPFEHTHDKARALLTQHKIHEKLFYLATEATKEQPALKADEAKIIKQATLPQATTIGRNGNIEGGDKAGKSSLDKKFAEILGASSAIPQEAIQSIFDCKKGDAARISLPYLDPKTHQASVAHLVARVVDVVPADVSVLKKNQQAFEQMMQQALTSDIMALFFDGLQKRFPVKTFDFKFSGGEEG